MTEPIDPLPRDVLDAIQRGDRVEAIKLVRERTGLGLKEAKDRIERELQGNGAVSGRAWSTVLPPAASAALQRGDKIEAIRILREETGVELKDAKQAIDAIALRTQTERPVLAPGEVPRSRSLSLWLIALAIVVGIVTYLAFPRT